MVIIENDQQFRHIRFFILIVFFNLAAHYPLFSQGVEEWIATRHPFPAVQVYLHTDREFYFQGDTIWFKAYIPERYTKQLTEGYENLYVDLISEAGKIITREILLSVNGEAAGFIPLHEKTKSGNFWLRAYTSYLKTRGEEAFYCKPVRILEILNTTLLQEQGNEKQKQLLPDVSFLPEGGFLLANCSNLVAVKAVDQTGKGIALKGLIFDELGDSVTAFKTGYRGMGSFYLWPSSDKSYHARLTGYPGFRKDISAAQKEGIKLHLDRQDKVEMVVNVVLNSRDYAGRSFILAGISHGSVQFYKEFRTGEENRVFRIRKNVFPGGINRLILLNQRFEPVSERLVFSDNFEVNHLVINTDSAFYTTRSGINLEISDEINRKQDEVSRLSVAVVDENCVNADGPSHSVLSGLLLEPELKGYIENPAGYFVEDSVTSAEKLDLLMLTHGWCNYPGVNPAEENELSVYQPVWGIPLKGRAERLLGQKPLVNGNISLMIYKKEEVQFMAGKTDERGLFNFGRVFIYDSATIFVQARNEKGKTFTEVFLDSLFEDTPGVSPSSLDALRNFSDIPLELYRRKYFNELSMREFYPDRNTIMLGEVEVKRAKKETDDGHFRIYGTADNSMKITDRDIAYSDVITYLSGRVAGLMISGNTVSIRGMGTPLFVIDGMPFEGPEGLDFVRSIPMSDIDVVEVLKDVSNLALFGSRGANGVIAVYTKRGEAGSSDDNQTGTISQKIKGYQRYKEFYSPEYKPSEIDRTEPDYRTTLYWNPLVSTSEGKAGLSFFSCDEVANYKVFVEGITSEGRICVGSGQFSVDRFRKNNQP